MRASSCGPQIDIDPATVTGRSAASRAASAAATAARLASSKRSP